MPSFTTPNLKYSYWEDSLAVQALAGSQKVTTSGRYFIQGTDVLGCSGIAGLNATVYQNPAFSITDPAAVTYPSTIDLTKVPPAQAGITYSYWTDARATRSTFQPNALTMGGTYFIKGTSSLGCSIINPVKVTILPPPPPLVKAPNAFSPNGDGINDLYRISIEGVVSILGFKIFNRAGQLLHHTSNLNSTWDGKWQGKDLPIGTYYWLVEFSDVYRGTRGIQSGSVTLLR
jgi:gliding motility-associated-like protein